MDPENKNEGIDLSGILKSSDARVKLEEYRKLRSYYPETPKIVQWAIKYSGGIIKDERRASYALVAVAGAAIIISIFLFFSAFRSPSPPPPDEIIEVAGPEGER